MSKNQKIVILNLSTSDIVLYAEMADGRRELKVPASRENPEDRTERLHGEAETTSDFMASFNENKVVLHYFEKGMLAVKGDAVKTAPQATDDADQGGNPDPAPVGAPVAETVGTAPTWVPGGHPTPTVSKKAAK